MPVTRCSILLIIRPAQIFLGQSSTTSSALWSKATAAKQHPRVSLFASWTFVWLAWHAVSTLRTFFAIRAFRAWFFGSSHLSCCGMCMREILFFLRTKLLFWNFSPQLVAQTGAFAADGRPLTPIHATTCGLVLVATRKAASFRSLCQIITLSDLCLGLWVTWNF